MKKLLVILFILVFLVSSIAVVSAADFWVHTQDRHKKAWTSPNGFTFDDKANTLGFWVRYSITYYDKEGNLIYSPDAKGWNNCTMSSKDKVFRVPANAYTMKIQVIGLGMPHNVPKNPRIITIPAGDGAMVFSSILSLKNFHLKTLDRDGNILSTGYRRL